MEGVNEDWCLCIIKASRYSVVFGKKVEPYYGKYKGILATNNMVQLKQYYGSATGSILRLPTHHAQDNIVASRTMDLF
jgi:hypothetical protein